MTRMYRVTARRGRVECQEVRAPRTCPAVRMRRARAPQGKPSAFLLHPSSPPLRRGRGEAGDRWSARRRAERKEARPACPRPPASLKGQHLRAKIVSGWVEVFQPSHSTDGKLRFRGGSYLPQVSKLGNGRNWNLGLAERDGSLESCHISPPPRLNGRARGRAFPPLARYRASPRLPTPQMRLAGSPELRAAPLSPAMVSGRRPWEVLNDPSENRNQTPRFETRSICTELYDKSDPCSGVYSRQCLVGRELQCGRGRSLLIISLIPLSLFEHKCSLPLFAYKNRTSPLASSSYSCYKTPGFFP